MGHDNKICCGLHVLAVSHALHCHTSTPLPGKCCVVSKTSISQGKSEDEGCPVPLDLFPSISVVSLATCHLSLLVANNPHLSLPPEPGSSGEQPVHFMSVLFPGAKPGSLSASSASPTWSRPSLKSSFRRKPIEKQLRLRSPNGPLQKHLQRTIFTKNLTLTWDLPDTRSKYRGRGC